MADNGWNHPLAWPHTEDPWLGAAIYGLLEQLYTNPAHLQFRMKRLQLFRDRFIDRSDLVQIVYQLKEDVCRAPPLSFQ